MVEKNGKAILVVEDDVDLCNEILGILNNAGFRPTGVTNSRDALSRLKNQKYSCIVLDLRLGEENGEDLIDVVRTRPEMQNANTPIIVISGHLSKQIAANIAVKIQGAIVKPFTTESLMGNIKRVVG